MFQSSISSIKPDSLDWQINSIILTSTFTYSRTASTFSFDSITHQGTVQKSWAVPHFFIFYLQESVLTSNTSLKQSVFCLHIIDNVANNRFKKYL